MRTIRALLLLALPFALRAQNPTPALEVGPLLTNAANGTMATVQLIYDRGSTTAPALGAFHITFNYDPASAEVVNVAWGDPTSQTAVEPLGTGSLSGIGTTLPGVITLYKVALADAATLNSSQPQALVLATITFKLTAAATDILTISVRSMADSAGATIQPILRGGFIVII